MGGMLRSARSRWILTILLKLFCIAAVLLLAIRPLLTNPLQPFCTTPSPPSPTPPTPKQIPRKIWQIWHTPASILGPLERKRQQTWHEKNPHHRYELVTNQADDTYVRQHFAHDALVMNVFPNLTETIVRADFLRILILLAEGGVYADMDVECRAPIDTWVPLAYQAKVGVVLGIENDRRPLPDDVNKYHDHREHIWGVTSWALMAKPGHPFLQFLAESVAGDLIELAARQNRTLASMKLSYKEVIDTTGPGALTQAFLNYASKATGTVFTSTNATMLEEPMLVDDILLLPIRAFSTVEANKVSVDGAHSTSWPAVLYHWGAGTWKKDHSQKAG